MKPATSMRGTAPLRVVDPKRSALMARIRMKHTKPEVLVRKIAHGLGYRFRLHRRDITGTPDLTFIALRKVIFVHGCFWHQHAGCKFARLPKSRQEYWHPKLRRNAARDREVPKQLHNEGWRVMIIWECETASPAMLSNRIQSFLGEHP